MTKLNLLPGQNSWRMLEFRPQNLLNYVIPLNPPAQTIGAVVIWENDEWRGLKPRKAFDPPHGETTAYQLTPEGHLKVDSAPSRNEVYHIYYLPKEEQL